MSMFKKFGDSVQAHAKELADKVEAQAKETKAKFEELDLKKLSLQSLEGRASMLRESIACKTFMLVIIMLLLTLKCNH